MNPDTILKLVKSHYANKELDISLADNNRFITFSKIEKDRIIYCGVMDVIYKKVGGIGCRIVFTDYEKLLLGTENIDVLKKSTSIKASHFSRIIDWNFNEPYQVGFPIDFENKSDVIDYLERLDKYYNNIAKPFFKYWSDIRTYLPYIETSDIMEFTKILKNNSIIKKMIIWRLCDHPGYDVFAKERIEILERAVFDRPGNDNYKKVLVEMKEKYSILKNIQPKYEWDPSYLEKKDFSEYIGGSEK